MACVLTEDGVTGTTGYAQSNAYAGGGNGVMGGYELLPNPVPAASMVYDHVARTISPSFSGEVNSFPASVNAGESHTVTFSFTLPSTWDETNMHIIGMMLSPTGRIDNADKSTIPEAVGNGFVNGPAASVTEILAQPDATMQVYPNPANDFAVVALNLSKESHVALKLMDVSGKTIAVKNYGSMSGMMNIELNTVSLETGVYVVELTVDNEKLVKRLVVE